MNSVEVYRTLRVHLAPELKAAGFKRGNSMLSWVRRHGDRHLVVWCQVSQDAWDDYAGSKFIVEFQLSDAPTVGARHIRRQRLPKMLDGIGREKIRAIQNGVIASLRNPPANHPAWYVSEEVSGGYAEKFREIDYPYSDRDDIWFRYICDGDLATWADFITHNLPTCLKQAEGWT
jgi:hypothetical protein